MNPPGTLELEPFDEEGLPMRLATEQGEPNGEMEWQGNFPGLRVEHLLVSSVDF